MLDILVVISVIIIYIMLQKFAKIPQPLFLIGLALFSLIIYYPGVPQDDTTFIYQNFITGNYSDWQPPIYSLWWHLFHFKAADFIMNMVLYYSGLIYISYVLYRKKLHWQNNLLILFLSFICNAVGDSFKRCAIYGVFNSFGCNSACIASL